MTQEDKELLIQDLCARLPYRIMCHAKEINLDGELLFINKVYNIVAIYNDKATGKFDTYPIADTKPYLRLMSSMTEEEKKELLQISNFNSDVDDICYDSICCVERTSIDIADIANFIGWLNAHHFDYRNLIERGLAIDCTGLNVY